MKSASSTIVNVDRRVSVAVDAIRAESFLARGRGLMFRREFVEGDGLVIDPCSSIHMFFMRFPIDVLYMDRNNRVVRVQQAIKPWRMGPLWTRGAKYVIELPAGTIARTSTCVGDQIAYQ